MTEDDTSVVRDALIRETVGLATIALVLWFMGPGKIWAAGLVHRAKTMMRAPGDRIDTEVAQFRTQVSRWDHEQAAQAHRRPAKDGGCGCG